MGDASLKWLNFWSLSKSLLRPNEELSRVYFFTAVVTWDASKQHRHRNFIAAQKNMGVTVVESNFKKVSKFCEPGNRYCKRHEEKQTDVAFATTLLGDAVLSEVDRAILVTADTDQVPLARQMAKLFPEIQLTLCAPPGRADHAYELGAVIQDRVPLEAKRLLAHKLPRKIVSASGGLVAQMPEIYVQNVTTATVSGAPDPADPAL